MNKIAVAILNWNGVALLQRFLSNVVQNSPQADVYVIDNASTDNSVAYVKENFPTVKLVVNADNWGYAGGYNAGLKAIENPILILLNSDVEVTPGWLDAIEAHFDKHPQMAACQPKLRDLKAPAYFEYAGAAGGFIDVAGYPFCKGRIFGILEEDHGQYDEDSRIFWASGACLCIRRDVFFEVGALDADFFAHMEEIDLCWRVQAAGYEVRLCPNAVVFHLGGATLTTLNPQKTFLNFRNSLFCLVKNLPKNLIFKTVFLRLVLDGLAGVKFLVQFKWKHVLAIVHAHYSFYAHFRAMVRKRGKRQISIQQLGAYPGFIVWEHYFKRKQTFTDLEFKPASKPKGTAAIK